MFESPARVVLRVHDLQQAKQWYRQVLGTDPFIDSPLGVVFRTGDCVLVIETVAGYLLDTLGTVPRGGESVELGEFRLTVVDVEKNRISKVRIEKVVAPAVAG